MVRQQCCRQWVGRVGFSPSRIWDITTRGADYTHHITASQPGFENPAASLIAILEPQLEPKEFQQSSSKWIYFPFLQQVSITVQCTMYFQILCLATLVRDGTFLPLTLQIRRHDVCHHLFPKICYRRSPQVVISKLVIPTFL